jgi:hypothetical protein
MAVRFLLSLILTMLALTDQFCGFAAAIDNYGWTQMSPLMYRSFGK